MNDKKKLFYIVKKGTNSVLLNVQRRPLIINGRAAAEDYLATGNFIPTSDYLFTETGSKGQESSRL